MAGALRSLSPRLPPNSNPRYFSELPELSRIAGSISAWFQPLQHHREQCLRFHGPAEEVIHARLAAASFVFGDYIGGEGDYDLILMDEQMPRADGLEATKAIRVLPHANDIPILAMKAKAFEGDSAQCLAVGMNDFSNKPADPAVLQATIVRWLRSAF